MSRTAEPRTRPDPAAPRRCRPALERLEDRWVPAAVRQLSLPNALPRGDDLSSGPQDLGFNINFLGYATNRLFVNTNGNATLNGRFESHNTFPLHYTGRVMLAPFFGNVDTTAAGDVRFGPTTVDGHQAFAVTWEGVGYNVGHDDRTNTFQLVIINRSDLGPGNFDLEYNYDRITWDLGDTTGGGNTANPATRAGYSWGIEPRHTHYELVGSNVPGAFLDGGSTSLAANSLNSTVAGRYVFFARDGGMSPKLPPLFDAVPDQTLGQGGTLNLAITSSDPRARLAYTLLAGPQGAVLDPVTGVLTWQTSATQPVRAYRFEVAARDQNDPSQSLVDEFLVGVDRVIYFSSPKPPAGAVGTVLAMPGRIPGTGAFTATIDYGDNTGLVVKPLAGGDFSLSHTYLREGVFTVRVTVTDATGNVSTATTSVVVLPPGFNGSLEDQAIVTARPGETLPATVKAAKYNANIDVQYTRSPGAATDSVLFTGIYTTTPLKSDRVGTFFDLLIPDAISTDKLTLTFRSEQIGKKFEFGFFRPADGVWVPLLNNENLCTVFVDPATGTMTVTFTPEAMSYFKGTVFTVSLPPASGTQAPANIRPPQASTGDGTGQSRTVTFTSNTQLRLALTASGETQLSVNRTARGSQANEAANGVASSGGKFGPGSSSGSRVKDASEADQAESVVRSRDALLEYLQTDEGLLELWLHGIDPATLFKTSAEVEAPRPDAAWLVAFDAQPPVVGSEDVAAIEEAVAPEAVIVEPVAVVVEEEATPTSLLALALVPAMTLAVRRRRDEKRLPMSKV